MAADFAVTAVLCIAIVIVVATNILFLIVVAKRKRIRTPENTPRTMLYVNLSVINILGAVLWTLFTSISSADSGWVIHRIPCRIQVFMMTFCNLMNAHTLLILMFERFLRIFRPAKHQEIFFDVIVMMMLIAVYLLDGLIASFTLFGWGTSSYFQDQYQCAINFEESTTHYDFTIAMHFGIPFVAILIFYVAILIRIRFLRQKLHPGQRIVLQENMAVSGDSYGDRLKKQHMKFHGAAASTHKPKMKKAREYQNDGFASDDDDDNSDVDNETKEEAGGNKRSRGPDFFNRKADLKKTYYLTHEDMSLTHMVALMAAVYLAFWMPYIVHSYIYTYYFFQMTIDKTFTHTAVVMSHLSPCFYIPLYLISGKLRPAIKKTLRLGGDGPDDAQQGDGVKVMTTTL